MSERAAMSHSTHEQAKHGVWLSIEDSLSRQSTALLMITKLFKKHKIPKTTGCSWEDANHTIFNRNQHSKG